MNVAATGAARPGRLKPIALAALAALAVGILGGLMTDIGPWYQSLVKPSWQPPRGWRRPSAWRSIW